MSYARFGPDSDVYVYRSMDPRTNPKRETWLCCSCIFHREDKNWADAMFYDRIKMIAHLGEHRQAGHKVRQRTIDRLNDEQVLYEK